MPYLETFSTGCYAVALPEGKRFYQLQSLPSLTSKRRSSDAVGMS